VPTAAAAAAGGWLPAAAAADPQVTSRSISCDAEQKDDYASIINMGMKVTIEESTMCEYTYFWKSRHACPLSADGGRVTGTSTEH